MLMVSWSVVFYATVLLAFQLGKFHSLPKFPPRPTYRCGYLSCAAFAESYDVFSSTIHGNATPRLNAIRFAACAGFAHWLIHNASFLSFVIDLIFCSRPRFTCPCRKTGFVVAQNDGFVDEPYVLVRLPGLHHLSVAHWLMALRPPSGPAAASQKFGPQRERLLSASLARGLAIAPMAVRHPFVVLPGPSPTVVVMSY
jgi:hypothetical protein